MSTPLIFMGSASDAKEQNFGPLAGKARPLAREAPSGNLSKPLVRTAPVKRSLALIALVLAAPLSAVPGGRIGTLPNGAFRCELPGDAGGPVGHRVPDADFTIVTSSTYRAGEHVGSYLLTGDRVVMTSGPFKGRRFRRVTPNFLRLLRDKGDDGVMRCVRLRGIGR